MTLRTLQSQVSAIHEKKKFDIASIMAAASTEPRSPLQSNSGSNSERDDTSKNGSHSPEVIPNESSERGSSPNSVSFHVFFKSKYKKVNKTYFRQIVCNTG